MSKTSRLLALGLALACPGCDDDDDAPSGASGAPGVTCSATPTNGVVPLTVQFSATVSADDDAAPLVSWSFGDGTAASVPSAARTYIAPGTYTAVAEVRSQGRSASCSVSVTARPVPVAPLPPNRPPLAQFKTNPTPPEGAAPLTVHFNACQSSDPEGDRLLFRFDVFDGLYDSGHCRREHTYRTKGTYAARMCVTDEFPGHEDICQSYSVTVK